MPLFVKNPERTRGERRYREDVNLYAKDKIQFFSDLPNLNNFLDGRAELRLRNWLLYIREKITNVNLIIKYLSK